METEDGRERKEPGGGHRGGGADGSPASDPGEDRPADGAPPSASGDDTDAGAPAQTSGERRAGGDDRSGGSPSGAPAHAADARAGDGLLARSLALVRFLRRGCPWDARQTPESLRPYLLEEAHEAADAILAGDDRALAGELGDLLLNLAFQIVVAEERGAFDAGDVVRRLEAKMEARHPHVYGDAEEPPDWEEMKVREREAGRGRAADDRRSTGMSAEEPAAEVDVEAAEAGAAGREPGDPGGDTPPGSGLDGDAADPFAGVPGGLEALSRSLRVQQRAAALGFDWPDVGGAVAKLREEIRELEELLERLASPASGPGGAGGATADGPDDEGEGAGEARGEPGGVSPGTAGDARAGGTVPDAALEEEVGDLLFAAVNVARLASVHPTGSLERATAKFEERFRELARRVRERGLDLEAASLEAMEAVWREVKRAEG